ncbi:MAG: hypothetical protein AAF715_30515 [Myxococcota bacterium]
MNQAHVESEESGDADPGLESLALVEATEQEGLSLEGIFEEFGIDEATWRAQHRVRLIQEAAADTAGYKRYQAALEAAQDRYARPVAPLYEDPEVWGQYVKAMTDPAGTVAVLAASGMCLGDLARLERHWRGVFRDDEAAGKRARAAGEQFTGDAASLPPVTIGERTQGSSSASSPAEASPSDDPGAREDEDAYERVERAAVLTALLALDDDGAALQRRTALSAEAARSEVAAVTAALLSDPLMQNFYRRRVDHLGRVFGDGASEPTPPMAAPTASSVVAAVSAPPAAPPAPVVVSAPTDPIDVTGPVDLAKLGLAALPFDPNAEPVLPAPVVMPPRTDAGETAVVNLDIVMSLDAQSPFPIAQPEAAPSAAEEGSTPQVATEVAGIDETAAVDLAALAQMGPALPFAPASEPFAAVASHRLPSGARGRGDRVRAPRRRRASRRRDALRSASLIEAGASPPEKPADRAQRARATIFARPQLRRVGSTLALERRATLRELACGRTARPPRRRPSDRGTASPTTPITRRWSPTTTDASLTTRPSSRLTRKPSPPTSPGSTERNRSGTPNHE